VLPIDLQPLPHERPIALLLTEHEALRRYLLGCFLVRRLDQPQRNTPRFLMSVMLQLRGFLGGSLIRGRDDMADT
jgi:hypothetical protein